MQLKVIQEDSIHGYPLDALLIIKPILEQNMNTIHYTIYENETKYQDYLSGSLNTDFNRVVNGIHYASSTLSTRIISEIPTSSMAVFPQLMNILYSELRTVPKFSELYWTYSNIL